MGKVAVLLAEGFEEIEALTVVDIMRRAEVTCHMVSLEKINVLGAHGIEVKSDKILDEEIKSYDLIVLPGGMPGARNLQENRKVLEIVKYFHENKKLVSAICAAPIVLGSANIIKGKSITSYPGFEDELQGCNYKEEKVVVDGNIITSRGPATAMEFAYKLLEILGNDKYKAISDGMLYS
ncbi:MULTISPECIES: DJ-1 family glyoxalase III [Clostridium]|uniref:DJ-1/PfpI family protein n=1 Tax=Clostridium cibarium TaxID=2762247 RepID=A0ABR8PNZ1_9CLOT|nr:MULTISPECIES: DJ-1 family glyoxalase III [Clostridium]MBD7909898.1 DJ-1/PfpI family protein [Clostridium cibarium]